MTSGLGQIAGSDLLTVASGSTPLEDQPPFIVFAEPDLTRSTAKIATLPQYMRDDAGERITRLSDGSVKFGRMAVGPKGQAAFLLSSFDTDRTLHQRQEIVTSGVPLDLPQRRTIWIAARYYLDFDALPFGEWVAIGQIKPTPSTSPPLSISIYGVQVNVSLQFNPADSLQFNYTATEGTDRYTIRGIARFEVWQRRWFDLCIRLNLDPRNRGGGQVRMWFDDIEVLRPTDLSPAITTPWGGVISARGYDGPLGFGGLVPDDLQDKYGKRRIANWRWSNYPGRTVPTWGGGRRDVWISRAFITKSGAYTLSQVRQALVLR